MNEKKNQISLGWLEWFLLWVFFLLLYWTVIHTQHCWAIHGNNVQKALTPHPLYQSYGCSQILALKPLSRRNTYWAEETTTTVSTGRSRRLSACSSLHTRIWGRSKSQWDGKRSKIGNNTQINVSCLTDKGRSVIFVSQFLKKITDGWKQAALNTT